MYDLWHSKWLYNVKSIFVFASIIIFLKFVLKIFSRNPKWVRFGKQLSGPYAYPLIGNSFELMVCGRNGFTPLFKRYIKSYGKTFRLWIADQLVVVLSDPKDVETVLLSSNCLKKAEILVQAFHELFGDSLVFAEPSLWKQKRRAFRPFFSKNAVLSCLPIMNQFVDEYVEEMKKLADGPEFNLKNLMNDLSLETIMKTHLEFEVKARKREIQVNVVENMSRAVDGFSALMMCRWQILKMIFALILSMDISTTKKVIYNFIDEIMNSHRKSLNVRARSKVDIEDENHESEMLSRSYLNGSIKLGEELGDDKLIFKEISLLLLGAIETTGVTTSACIFALAAHPHVQEKVYQELYEVYGNDERPVEKSDLDKFPYLDQVIKESQRLYTIVPAIFRSIPENTKIGNYIYPEGTAVIICIAGIHRDSDTYPNPDSFNPENFSPEAISKRHKFSFIPFSGGARNCIGKSYAEITVKLRLIALLRTFSFHTTKKPEDIKFKTGFIEESAIGYPISITLRKKSA